MKKTLVDFLHRMPWASRYLLEKYFGPEDLENDIHKYSERITSIKRADDQIYYSVKPANYHLLPGISRREMVRKFMADQYGYSVFDSAESPCGNADLRTFHEDSGIWTRVWGDMGHIAPECLLIFRNPPVFSADTHDIVVTCQVPERISFLKIQAEINWEDAQKGSVEIFEIGENFRRSIRPEFEFKRNMKKYDPQKEGYPEFAKELVPPFNDTGEKQISVQEIRSTSLCRLSAELEQQDYDLLRFIACNPFLTIPEIALLFGGNSCCAMSYTDTEAEYKNIMMGMDRAGNLVKKNLLKIISQGQMEDTCIPAWQGVDLLAAYQGTIPFYLKKYSQWPQKSFAEKDFAEHRALLDERFSFFDSHCFYTKKWGEIRPEHQILCNKFCSALICGARFLKSVYGFNIEVSGLTAVSSNLKISSVFHGRNIIKQLHPDGCCTVTCSGTGFSKKWKLFIEIERNRNDKKDLLEKLEKYRDFIPAAKQFYEGYDDVIVMFFYDDSEEERNGSLEEKRRILLETMRNYGIRGCFGRLSDARKSIEGWDPKHDTIEKETCGNMYVYRKMWQVSDYWPDSVKLPFPYFLL